MEKTSHTIYVATSNKATSFIEQIKNLFSLNDLLKQLVVRDIKLKYRRSYLGYLWSILNPLLTMTVLVIVFSNIFSRFEIDNFPLYLICGQIIFSFMSEATNNSVQAIVANRSLLKKTRVNKYIFPLAKVTSSMVNSFFSLGALILVMIFTQASLSWAMFFFPFVILQVYIFSLGLSFFLAAAAVFFRDIRHLWGVFLTMWMYLTPIFYPVSIIAEKYLVIYKNINPMYGYLEQFRTIVLHSVIPEWSTILTGFLTALVALLLGSWYFYKKQDDFILYI